jgi:hypothetical protein
MLAETICSAVAAAGLGVADVTAYRRRFLAATRIAAYALVPAGLVMTGLVKWVVHTAFSPTAWAGFGVLAVAWLLFMTTRAVERRRGGTRKERRAAAAGAQQDAVAPQSPAPSLGSSGGRTGSSEAAPGGASGRASGSGGGSEDFSDIEAILKKHGI